jgi:D-alanyl-D-alanine dipeptidase
MQFNSPDTPDNGFLNVQAVDPDIFVDLRYATANNFTNKVVYDFNTAIARAGTVRKLAKASKLVKEKGFRLKIWDAYRPVSAQKKLFDVYPDPNWVLEPNPNASHQKGVTFDLTLCEPDGTTIPMQSKFDEFGDKAKRNHPRKPYQEHNYRILNNAMTEAGFVGYSEEWWDYRDADMDSYGPASADPNDYKL